jgi:hypothetical protein
MYYINAFAVWFGLAFIVLLVVLVLVMHRTYNKNWALLMTRTKTAEKRLFEIEFQKQMQDIFSFMTEGESSPEFYKNAYETTKVLVECLTEEVIVQAGLEPNPQLNEAIWNAAKDHDHETIRGLLR